MTISVKFNLINSEEYAAAQQNFALESYLPPISKTALRRDSEKEIKPLEVRKHLKKIRTDLQLDAVNKDTLPILLSFIVSSIVNTQPKLLVFAQKGEKQWKTLSVFADLSQIEILDEIKSKRLVQSANHLGHFHSKPFNTLSSVQFCRDENYAATGQYGFTENQRDNTTANLSISGGSNAFSAYYAILITRINHLSIAEHLIQDAPIAVKIQQFFQRFLTEESFDSLQTTLKTCLSKTAGNTTSALHALDKQIILPTINTAGDCDYINITPIINPTIFAASSRAIFYVKGQSVPFSNIVLGGANPSNAGSAVGEVVGQNSRLKMVFPTRQVNIVRTYLYSFRQDSHFFWSKSFKQSIEARLIQYAKNDDIKKADKRTLLTTVVSMALLELLEQIALINTYLESVNKKDYEKIISELSVHYHVLFKRDDKVRKKNPTLHKNLLSQLKNSFRQLRIFKSLQVDEANLIIEIEKQFKDQVNNQGGF